MKTLLEPGNKSSDSAFCKILSNQEMFYPVIYTKMPLFNDQSKEIMIQHADIKM